MAIPHSELQSLNPSAILELFVLELVEGLHYATGNPDSVPTTFRFHSGSNMNSNAEIVWQGKVIAASKTAATCPDHPEHSMALALLKLNDIYSIIEQTTTTASSVLSINKLKISCCFFSIILAFSFTVSVYPIRWSIL